MSFAASVLKVTNSCRNTTVLFGHSFSEKLDFQDFKVIFPYKKQRVLPSTYKPIIFENSVVLHLI